MKKIISFAVILLILFSLCSCKQKSDDEELASLNKENSVSKTDKTNDAESETEKNVDTSPAPDKSADITENESDTKTQFENTTDDLSSENTEVSNAETESAEQSFNNYEHVCRFYYTKATHNDVTYNKIINRDYFGEASIYHEIDFSTLELTKETVEIEYYCPLETDGYGCHLRKTAVICKLPDIMANDKIIDFLVVRFEDGEYDMLFDIDPPKDSTLYELHEALQRLYGEAFDSSEFIEKIIIHHGIEGDAYEVNDRVNISKIYNIVTSATRTSSDDTIKYEKNTSYYIVLYNDNMYKYYNVGDPSYGAHAHQLVYENEYIDALPYNTDYHLNYENFEELLQSFMTEENLVKE